MLPALRGGKVDGKEEAAAVGEEAAAVPVGLPQANAARCHRPWVPAGRSARPGTGEAAPLEAARRRADRGGQLASLHRDFASSGPSRPRSAVR